ncbi:hypothetical protein [Reichenbachiella sp. MALMAid0571]|uniref:hypothetical protein n=1 Tax=Reichenbachiella sp. MALMAid0571 TaxID=3143939 RepID=UPI0032DF62FA
MKQALVIILFLTTTSYVHAGGGWVNGKGKGFFKLSEWWVVADAHYTDTGEIDPNVTIGLFNTTLYGEYGLSDKFDVILNFPVFSRSYSNLIRSKTTGDVIAPGQSVNSLGDAELGMKYGWIRNKAVVVSSTIYFGLPLGNDMGGDNGTLQTGDGEFNQRISLDISTSAPVGNVNTFYSVNLGLNNRTRGFSDEFRYGLETGLIVDKKVIGIFRLQGLKSFKNSSFTETNGATLFASDTEYLSYTFELGYEIKERYGISANMGKAFSGNLIFANPSYSIGVHVKI